MSLKKEKIKRQLSKQLKAKGVFKTIIVYRNEINEFKEPTVREIKVCEIEGYYYKGKSDLNINIADAGAITTNHKEKLLMVCNEDSLLIKQGDFFYQEDVKYEIIDKGNSFDIVFDMALERV